MSNHDTPIPRYAGHQHSNPNYEDFEMWNVVCEDAELDWEYSSARREEREARESAERQAIWRQQEREQREVFVIRKETGREALRKEEEWKEFRKIQVASWHGTKREVARREQQRKEQEKQEQQIEEQWKRVEEAWAKVGSLKMVKRRVAKSLQEKEQEQKQKELENEEFKQTLAKQEATRKEQEKKHAEQASARQEAARKAQKEKERKQREDNEKRQIQEKEEKSKERHQAISLAFDRLEAEMKRMSEVLARADHVLAEQQLKTSELLARADQILAEQELRHTQREANNSYCQSCREVVEPGLEPEVTSGEQDITLEAEDDRDQTQHSHAEMNPAVIHRLASPFDSEQALVDVASLEKTIEDFFRSGSPGGRSEDNT
jgi:trichohyalin